MIPDEGTPSQELEARLRFETLLSELSTRFINLPAGEVDREIEDALSRVCELLGIDSRCFGNGRHRPRMSSRPPTPTPP